MTSNEDYDKFEEEERRSREAPKRQGNRSDSPFEFNSEDFRSDRELPPLVLDGEEFFLRSDIDTAFILGIEGPVSVMDNFESFLTEDSFEAFRDWVTETSPPPALLNAISEKVSEAYRSGNRKARRARSSRSRSRR